VLPASFESRSANVSGGTFFIASYNELQRTTPRQILHILHTKKKGRRGRGVLKILKQSILHRRSQTHTARAATKRVNDKKLLE